MSADLYELDTARAKTPAERLRIVADLMEAQERGERVFCVHYETGALMSHHARENDASVSYRYVTKRRPSTAQRCCKTCNRIIEDERPVIVIPALELFEGPMTEAPEFREYYYTPTTSVNAPHPGCYYGPWRGDSIDLARLAGGLVFRTQEAAARIGLHIRNELSNYVAVAKAVRP
jgi:hypothetical protein